MPHKNSEPNNSPSKHVEQDRDVSKSPRRHLNNQFKTASWDVLADMTPAQRLSCVQQVGLFSGPTRTPQDGKSALNYRKAPTSPKANQ